jgi:hypothetical protein
MLNIAEIEKYKSVFFPHTLDKTNEAIGKGGRFAYYTTADVAINVLKTSEIWMRNTRMMNDFMEFTYGFELLRAAYKSEVGVRLKEVLERRFPGLWKEVEDHFNAWVPGIERDTYITCMSLHECVSEQDSHGRLSMLRAYGGKNGVALVVNGAPMFSITEDLGVYSSPVAYFNDAQFVNEFGRVVANIESEADYIDQLDRETLSNAIFQMFRFASHCTKHPGFQEEQEWRLLTTPGMAQSPLVRADVEIIRGTPQVVQKLILKDLPEKGLLGVDISKLLDHIIIGPCDFPDVVYQAVFKTLQDIGIDPKGKIKVSNIPLRHFL